ncbi:Predicted RNA polymerase sigma factor, contains C-terminal TPR domain [Micromonospora phaseoli]|uniref:Predicted RNA polymerase sigma factor, contains C-terminal TPR domain n=1 Tax=Micromonospora phaseoli TaxID=1144548 RepID=A0A1H7CQ70_9ACTN|nr:putative RNA polymerase sigma factor [Micromonospora phaseoli]GIJ78544.1 RNA polymerase sigma24 factor [Micromonospora phaseoli]SEJ87935.1 Predicted RNA polymerase sigma factor, contains C-terminal TPR domain [Micromonospora phaseoli]
MQEALVAAVERWPHDGVPEHPSGWLHTVAARRYVDQVRTEAARVHRERAMLDATPRDALVAPPPDAEPPRDDLLELFLLCCHPVLPPPAQLALTLRAVGGLTTAEVAAAFLVPEKTMGQRISRAKQRLREADARFALPPQEERGPRLAVVRQVLYLMFNEGYSASSGPDLRRAEVTQHALRLARRLHDRLPHDGETAGLLALMLLTEARAAARVGPDGELVPLAEQDRGRWDRTAIDTGTALVAQSLATSPPGPYQVQAAIAAVHAEAPTAQDTDWPQVLALYEVLDRLAPNPVATLSRAVALGMVHGPAAGLALLAEVESGLLAGHHRLHAVRAHLLELADDRAAAVVAWRAAASLAGNDPERRHLLRRAAAASDLDHNEIR